MTIEKAYLSFVNIVNRNLTNNNVNVDKPRFVLLFNDIQNRYLEWLLEKRNEDSIRYATPLLTVDKKLTLELEESDKDFYNLPEDYFDLANLSIKATKGKCKNVSLHCFEVKSEDTQELLNDKFNEPSFDYRETFYMTSSNSTVAVFKKDFSINNVYATYYRYPKKVDIEGYINETNAQSQSIDPEWDDKVTGRILVAMSKEFAAINSDGGQYELGTDRLFKSI